MQDKDIPQQYIDEAEEMVDGWDSREEKIYGLADILSDYYKHTVVSEMQFLGAIIQSNRDYDVVIEDVDEFVRWADGSDKIDIPGLDALLDNMSQIKRPGRFIDMDAVRQIDNAYDSFEEEMEDR